MNNYFFVYDLQKEFRPVLNLDEIDFNQVIINESTWDFEDLILQVLEEKKGVY